MVLTRKTVTQQSRSLPLKARDVIKKRLPITNWLPTYNLSIFMQDMLAGLTVGLTEIPQGIAYASVAGLPAQYGLYSGFMGCFIYCIFGSVKDINIGPTAIMAIMIHPYVERFGPAMSVLMTFLAGSIIFVLGLLQLGFMVEFFSYPVIAGFTSAAAVTIGSSQLNSLLGLKGKGNEFLDAWKSFFEHVGETSMNDTLLGVGTIVVLMGMRELKRLGSLNGRPEWTPTRKFIGRFMWILSLSRNALLVILTAILAYILKENGETPFKLIDNVIQGLPSFEPPPFSITTNTTHYNFGQLLGEYGGALAFLPLIAILETIAIAKAFSKGKTVDATQEMLALGLCNIAGSFVGSMPVTGSFTRTAVNNASGVRTTFGGVVTGIMVLLALGFLTSSFTYIPKTVLAAVVITAMVYLFEYEAIVVFWKTNRLDLVPYVVTLIASLLLGLEYGILIGVAVNLVFVLYYSARPNIVIEHNKVRNGQVFVVKLERILQFPAAEYLREKIMLDCNENAIPVIVDGSRTKTIDVTVAKNLETLIADFVVKNQRIIFWNFKDRVKDIIVGIDHDLIKYFRIGQLDDLLTDEELSIHRNSIDASSDIENGI